MRARHWFGFTLVMAGFLALTPACGSGADSPDDTGGASTTPPSTTVAAGEEGKAIGVSEYQVSGGGEEGYTLVGVDAQGKEVTRVWVRNEEGGRVLYRFSFGDVEIETETMVTLDADGTVHASGDAGGAAFTMAVDSEGEVTMKEGQVALDEPTIQAWNSWAPVFETILPESGLQGGSCIACIGGGAGIVVGAVACLTGAGCLGGAIGIFKGAKALANNNCLDKCNPCSLAAGC